MEHLSLGQALMGMFRLVKTNLSVFFKATLLLVLFTAGAVALVVVLTQLLPDVVEMFMDNPLLGGPALLLVVALIMGVFAVTYGRGVMAHLAADHMGSHGGLVGDSLKFGLVNILLIIPVGLCGAGVVAALIAKAFGMKATMGIPLDPTMAMWLFGFLTVLFLIFYLRLGFVNGQIFLGQKFCFRAAWKDSEKVWVHYLIAFILLAIFNYFLQRGVQMLEMHVMMQGMHDGMQMGAMHMDGMHMQGMQHGMHMGGGFLHNLAQHGWMKGIGFFVLQVLVSLLTFAFGLNLLCHYYVRALKR